MSKRSATETVIEGQPYPKASSSGNKRDVVHDEIGEFEDAWEDEMDSDEEVVDAEQTKENDMDVDAVIPPIEESEEKPPASKIFIPGSHSLADGEVLEADESVYMMRHTFKVKWPCLSFDVLRDSLGNERQRYPHTSYIAAGTQADSAKNNELVVYKLSSLHRTQKDGAESDSDDGEEDDEHLDEDPVLEYRSIPHMGGINRLRAQPLPQSSPLPPVSQPYYVSTWSETGKVHIWDVRPLVESLDVPGFALDKSQTHSPAFTINSHRTEGFAMDWAASGPGSLRLLTGDNHSKIYLTTVSQSKFNALTQPFLSHTSSIEDLQWSPSEPTVFASCSADQSIRMWDVRTKGRKSAAAISPAHDSDVNVISWNKSTSYLLVSGGDEGGIKVWDLRNVKPQGGGCTPVASFDWHKGPITSIEWHPTEDSVFAAAGADDQVTLWDLAVEQDDEEMGFDGDGEAENVPSQLLFVHQGQKDIKELHWHPQIPGAVVSTAFDAFNVFKTISI